MDTKILIEKKRGIEIELREMLKDWIRDNNKEDQQRKDDLEGSRCRALLMDHSAIDFKSVFKEGY